jgi:hypothetical protein
MEREEFINHNVAILANRLHGQYTRFLDSKPTFVTWYHINDKLSTVDKGTKDIEALLDENSPIRYNKTEGLPIYNLDQMELALQEEEQGLDIDYDGEGIVLPNTLYPYPDDYFVISYLGKRFLFRITHVSYNSTIKGNSYHKINFTLKATTEKYVNMLEKLTVENYKCLFDNIGTSDKCIIRDKDYDNLVKVNKLVESLGDAYLEKYWNRKYNALMILRSGDQLLYDYQLNHFANIAKLFDGDELTIDSHIFYEEGRVYMGMEFEQSIFDRIMHKDNTDLNDVNIYYDMEPAQNTDSIFDYYRDKRVKYIAYYPSPVGPFANKLSEYIPKNFMNALDFHNAGILRDPYEIFIWHYMMEDINVFAAHLDDHLDSISKRRIPYDFHTFIFMPLVIYCLRQISKNIVVDTSVVDEHLLNIEKT